MRAPESWSTHSRLYPYAAGCTHTQLEALIQTFCGRQEGRPWRHGIFLAWMLSRHHRIWRLESPRPCHMVKETGGPERHPVISKPLGLKRESVQQAFPFGRGGHVPTTLAPIAVHTSHELARHRPPQPAGTAMRLAEAAAHGCLSGAVSWMRFLCGSRRGVPGDSKINGLVCPPARLLVHSPCSPLTSVV